MLEKKILVFSKISHNVCSFIFSLLSLFPRNAFFNLNFGQDCENYKKCYEKFGLPLKFINEQSVMYSLLSLYDMDKVEKKKSFLLGTTNQLLLMNTKLNCDCIINIDEGKITFTKSSEHKDHKHSSKVKDISNISNAESEKTSSTSYKKLGKKEKHLYKIITEQYKSLIHNSKNTSIYQTLKENLASNLKTERLEGNINLSIDNIPSAEENSQFNETEDFTRKIFYDYFINFFCDMAVIETISTDDSYTEEEKYKTAKMVLNEYNSDFILEWFKTANFKFWLKEHDNEIWKRSIYTPKTNVTIFYENGDCYIGEFEYGKKAGKGNFATFDNKYIYDGEWLNDKKHGNGQLFNNGIKYNGDFVNDNYCGAGVLMLPNGDIYEGDFKDGFINGMGHFTGVNGDNYVGNFFKGKFEGNGQLTSHTGEIYNGNFFDGKKYGVGYQINPDGQTFEGEFKDDKYNGEGILTQKNGITVKGIWSNGEFLEELRTDAVSYLNNLNNNENNSDKVNSSKKHRKESK